MLQSVAAGALAALFVQTLRWLQTAVLPWFEPPMAPAWGLPAVLIAGALIGLGLQSLLRRRRAVPDDYHGLADMLIHIHQSASPDAPARWVVRSAISAFFALFSGNIGVEGSAMEIVYAGFLRIRPRSARWFEQRRRTDASNSIAAGIAASFGAPFAAVLVPIELGIGGRTISSVICSLSAYLCSRYLMSAFNQRPFELAGTLSGISISSWQEWIALFLSAVACGLCGIALTWFVGYFGRGLRQSVGNSYLRRGLVGSLILVTAIVLYRTAAHPSMGVIEDLLGGRLAPSESGILFFAKALAFTFALSAFGTSGVFWPVFVLGGCFGFAFYEGVLHPIFPALTGFGPVTALAGATAFWGSMLGAPVAAAVLVYEITDNLRILLPCLMAGLLARELAHRLKSKTLFEADLRERGVSLVEGRLKSILGSLRVSDAMVTDFECALEHEPIAEAQSRLLRATHPFLPVIRADGTYSGLLTIDMVHDSLSLAQEREEEPTSHSSLSKLLEVKDILYRSGFQTPKVRMEDPLTITAGMFQSLPCVPVVDAEGKVRGLLFAQNVRLVYEREVARRSLQTQPL